ncbi:MAG: acyltransferase [Lentisphaerae bacterium RIFOXYA12_FULL_48_11]|nr:MAG: acyltransferase [Lentisphaerae bacterium RIFOXYA12_FULL_48_11]
MKLHARKLKVALIQKQYSHDSASNIAANSEAIHDAAHSGAKLVILPELHNSQYFCQTENIKCFDIAETIPGPSTRLYGHLARKLKIVLVCSLFEKRATGLYHNTAVALDKDGSIAGRYRKMHIPDDPGYYEKFYFTPGDLGFKPIKTSVGNLGVMVCWDQWYPEAARLMALAGADMLIYPTAIGWNSHDKPDEQDRQMDAWTTIQRSHAIANGLHVLSVNRTGTERATASKSKIDFWGSSFVAGPQGELIARAIASKEETLIAELDLDRSETVRRAWPFLRDRRIDEYNGLDRRFLT